MEQNGKINRKKLFIILLGIIVAFASFISCGSKEKEIDPIALCSEFYELNKHNNFDNLFNLQILGIRDRSRFNDSILKYEYTPVVIGITEPLTNANIVLPSYMRNADLKEKELFFARCDSSSIAYLKNKYKINSNDSIFEFYVKEVESIYSNYYQIKIPNSLPYTNIELNGRGNYIEFILYKNEEKKIKYSCYYVKDSSFSNNRLKEYFATLPKIDEHWYYDINWH